MNRERTASISFLLLRIVAGLLVFQPGAMKVFAMFGGIPAAVGGQPHIWSQAWIGGWLEVVGGILIMLGLFTRPAAFILSGEMAVAYFQFHQPNGTWPVQNNGAPAVLLCFIFLFICAYGAGEWSLDAILSRKKIGT